MSANLPLQDPSLIDLRTLVGHSTAVDAAETLEDVQKMFENTAFEFMAVLEGPRVLGVCSKRDIGLRLGSRYGFAIYSRKPVSLFVRNDSRVSTKNSFTDALDRAFSRPRNVMFDDVLLVDDQDRFIGLIFVHELVRLQTMILSENRLRVEQQKFEIEKRRAELEEDIRMAREIQMAFLPAYYPTFLAPDPPERPALRFFHFYEPAATIGGDFFSVRRISDSLAGIFFGDVMGHGVRSALVTAILRALVEELVGSGAPPGAVLSRINQDLREILKNAGSPVFVSCLFLQIDLRVGCVRFANGGHPAPFLLRRGKKQSVEPLETPDARHGTVLGLLDHALYETHEVSFPPGDALVLFTDGAFEIEKRNIEFGLDQLRNTILARINEDACGLVNTVVDRIRQFSAEATFPDDLCLLAVERLA